MDRHDDAPEGKGDLFTESAPKEREEGDPCVRVLEGHSKAVTALYYEDGCLVGPTSRPWAADVLLNATSTGHRIL